MGPRGPGGWGTALGVVGPTEQALADHSHGGVVGLVFGAFGECSQSVDLLVESFGKLIGEQGYAEMGYRTPEVGVGVATWAIRREWAMTHWRESASQPYVAQPGARDGRVVVTEYFYEIRIWSSLDSALV